MSFIYDFKDSMEKYIANFSTPFEIDVKRVREELQIELLHPQFETLPKEKYTEVNKRSGITPDSAPSCTSTTSQVNSFMEGRQLGGEKGRTNLYPVSKPPRHLDACTRWCRFCVVGRNYRYFLHGACNKGGDCKFLHDKSRAVPMDTVCRYYLFGRCSYGDKCRYDHVKKDKHSDSPSSTRLSSQYPDNGRLQIAPSKMVTLKKGGCGKKSPNTSKKDYKWAMAKDFVPGQKYYGAVSYADAVQPMLATSSSSFEKDVYASEEGLCPYYAIGECPYEENCVYLHGDICDLCGLPRLHPTNMNQREEHVKECIAEHEKEMELAFAIQHSKDKECGICLENVMEKEGQDSNKKFGILENCNHCFCLTCIRQWRNNRNSLIETHRACPSCRTHSDFVTPSKYWVECPEEKKKLISDYKEALSKRPCSYFKLGKGECPFNSKCFYRHALPDGKVVTSNIVNRRRRENAEGDIIEEENVLWDFISRRVREGDRDFSLEDEVYMFLLETLQDDDEDDNNNSLIRFALMDNFLLTDTDSDFNSDNDDYF